MTNSVQTKTHWKKLTNPDYLGAYDFATDEKERIVTISKVTREIVSGPDAKKEECTIIHFKEGYKPMIMNATNSKMLSKLVGSPYVEDWPGNSIKLVISKIKAFGEIVDALRIKSEKVEKKLPVLEPGSKNFEACKASLSNGFTIDQIKSKYQVSQEVETLLLTK